MKFWKGEKIVKNNKIQQIIKKRRREKKMSAIWGF